MTSRYGFLGRLSFLFALLALAACSGKSDKPLVEDEGEQPLGCAEDLDGDEYGLGCPKGDDCNDNDGSIHEGCAACSVVTEGCECAPGTAPVECVDKSLADEDTVLCKTGTRYCRDGKWSACESVAQFEVDVDRTKSVGELTFGLIIQEDGGADGGTQPCSVCSPQCFPVHDSLDPADGPLPAGTVVYADGGGITLYSELDGGDVVIAPTTDCTVGSDPTDTDCDGIPDNYEIVDNVDTKPFGTTATSIFMTLGPGESGTADIDLQFYLRTVDVYFLFDMTAGTVSNNGTPTNTADDFNVVDQLIDSLTANPVVPNQPFFSGSVTCADTDQDGLPNNTAGQGILGDLKCLVRDIGIGVGWTREVPFEGPVSNIYYGDDKIAGTATDFSEFLFEHVSSINTDTSSLATNLGKLKLKENAGGPNGQVQGLWLTAKGTEQYVGHDRPALPDQWQCPSGTFGYPCFRSTAVPVVVMVTGSGMYNGPTTDSTGAAISNLGTDGFGNTYPLSYPDALHAGKVHRGSYEGYIEVPNDNDDFSGANDAFRTDLWTNPGTGALIDDIGDDLLTFTGDTSGLNANVHAAMLSCDGLTSALGPDAIYYFKLGQDEANFRVSAEGTRFDSVIGIIKASTTTVPASKSFDVTTFPTDGDTVNGAHDLETLPSGINAVVQGELAATGNFPAEVMECYSHASQSKCPSTSNRGSDYAPDVVFKFNLEQDMRLWFQSVEGTWPSSMSLFDRMPQGVVDLDVMNSGTGKPYETFDLPVDPDEPSFDPGPLNGHAYRLITGTDPDCNAFDISSMDEDFADSVVLFSSAPDTDSSTGPTNSHCKTAKPTDLSSDMEIRFEITEDDTEVVFENSGDDPSMNSAAGVMMALRKIDLPDPNVFTPDLSQGESEDWYGSYSIPVAAFTPANGVTEFAQIEGDMTTMWSDVWQEEFISKVVPLNTTNTMTECATPYDDTTTYQDAIFKFSTVGTGVRDLKISALGVDGVEHFLSVHRKSDFALDPEVYGTYYETTTIDEVTTTPTTLTGGSYGGYYLSSNTYYTWTNDTSLATSPYDWDDGNPYDFVTCNTSAITSRTQYGYMYLTKPEGPVTIALTYPGTAWKSALDVIYYNGSSWVSVGGCSGGNNTNTRSLTFTPSANTSYYIVVGGYTPADFGAYTITVTPTINAHDNLANAHDLGTISDETISVTNTTNKTGVNQNYDSLSGTDYVSCNRTNRNTYDQVYTFRASTAGTNQIKISLTYPGTAWPANIQLYTKSGSNLGAKVAAIDSTGATSSNGCDGNRGTSPLSLTFTPTVSNQEYYLIVSGYDTADRGTYKLTVEDRKLGAVGCVTTTAPDRATITLTDMPEDTYYVVLKIDNAGGTYAGTYDVTIEDATNGPTSSAQSTFVCEYNNYTAYEDGFVNNTNIKRTKLEQTLDKGTYSLIIRSPKDSGTSNAIRLVMRDKAVMPDVVGCHNNGGGGSGGESKSYFDYSDTPLPACEDGYLPSNECKDAGGVSHYKDYYLVMRAYNESDVADVADPNVDYPYTVYIRDLDGGDPLNFCEVSGNGLNTFNGSLTAGNYFAVVKGITEADKGWYQLTIGDTTTKLSDANFTDLKSYSGAGGVLEALNQEGVRVIGVQDGTDATVKKQLGRVAYDTNTKFLNSQNPLVIQLSDTVSGTNIYTLKNVGYGVTSAIQELAKALVMDVTLVLDATDPDKLNPGFTFDVDAVGTEPDCAGGISADGTTWKSCATGAEPRFEVHFGNPANAPVTYNDEDGDGIYPPTDTDDPGGYNMTLNLVGKVQVGTDGSGNPIYRSYIVEQIPVRIIPEDLGYTGPVRYYSESGTYSQDFRATECLTAETPDWSRLTWNASIPNDSSIEWRICSANDEAGAETCSSKWVATVTSGASCTSDANCTTADDFCDTQSGKCLTIEGQFCGSDNAMCGTNGYCRSDGYCGWTKLPIDVAPAMQYGDNGKKFVRVDSILYSSSDHESAPTIYNWELQYDCVSGE